LREQVARLARHLAGHPELSTGDVCHTLNAGRALFAHRLALSCGSLEEGRALLEGFPAGVKQGTVTVDTRPRMAFVFPGQGAIPAEARELYGTSPTFRTAFDRAARAMGSDTGLSLIDRAEQPAALFAIEYALGELWKSWGSRADRVRGDGVGGLVAACLSGKLSLEDAAQRATRNESAPPADPPREGDIEL